MNRPPPDAGIPILTEVIPNLPELTEVISSPPPLGKAVAPPVPPVPSVPSVTPEQQAASAPPAAAEWDAEQWERMEREVRERVLQQVLERIDFVLEQRVRDSLADVLQTAVESLASEIRGGLHNTVKEVITRAVSQEITKLQSTKK